MNNYYTLIYLTEHINNKLENAVFRFSISPHRNVWEGYFELQDGSTSRLVFSTTPGETTIFTDKFRAPKKSNVIHFFETLEGEKTGSVSLAEGDRLISIHFSKSTQLKFQLFGNKSNLLLVQENQIIDAFKKSSRVVGTVAPQPRKPQNSVDPPDDISTKRQLLRVDQKLPRHLIKPITEYYNLEDAKPGRIREVAEQLTLAMEEEPSFRVLETGNLCLIPDHLLPLPNRKIFDHINDAVRYCYYKTSSLRRFDKKMQIIRPGLEKALKKAWKALRQLEDAEKALERADKYEKYGHLLMAHAHEERNPASGTFEVTDFYNNNEIIRIDLKDHLSIAENAEDYYKRSAKAKRRTKESKRRKKEIQLETRKLELLLESLNRTSDLYELEDWVKENQSVMEKFGVIGGSGQKKSLPWRKEDVGGYEIRIGKNAKSNDKLTSRCHKEDIWLHARGTGGSHVVICMQNHTGYPPRHVVLRAASLAAYHSGLRGSKLVPVIVTKRKYVTKPKGAPAGTVRVQREEVEMVTPKK